MNSTTDRDTKKPSWFRMVGTNVKLFFDRERHFSFSSVFFAIATFIVSLTIIYGAMIGSKILDGSTVNISKRQYIISFLISLGLLFLTYIKEKVLTNKSKKQVHVGKVIYDCIGGAIDQLVELRAKRHNNKGHYICELIKYSEKVIQLILKEAGKPVGEISANLMIKRDYPDRLEIEYFGTRLANRCNQLPLSLLDNPPLPGAPEAYKLASPVYIPDTRNDKYKKFFVNKPYRSILSIPIQNLNGTVFAILNIDSDIPDQFINKQFIDTRILPIISPFLGLLRMEQASLVASSRIKPRYPRPRRER